MFLLLESQQQIQQLIAFIEIIGMRFESPRMTDPIKCPYCGHHTSTNWESLYTIDYKGDTHKGFTCGVRNQAFNGDKYDFDWMVCYNDACQQVIVRVQKKLTDFRSSTILQSEEWYAVPRKRFPRPIDPIVPEEFSKHYVKASLILEDAPDMSGILSRRILADLLKKYAGREEYKLEDQIDKFIDDPTYPSSIIKENLHHLREIGNFAAHTKENKLTGEVVEVGPEEAEWTLDVIDDLFDFFIVSPEKSRQRRAAWDLKRGPQNPPAKKAVKP